MANENSTKAGQYLTFALGANWYGAPIRSVREINQMSTITPVPKTPPFVRGVINLRGKIIPVVDLRLKLGLTEAAYNKGTCVIVFEAEAGAVGVIVDQVNEVVDLSESQVEPSPALGGGPEMDYLIGMGKLNDRVLVLVDIVKSLSRETFMLTMKDLAGQAA
jgi:purine-binding chemotaxis protein CheW